MAKETEGKGGGTPEVPKDAPPRTDSDAPPPSSAEKPAPRKRD